jgi:hypothetical protein
MGKIRPLRINQILRSPKTPKFAHLLFPPPVQIRHSPTQKTGVGLLPPSPSVSMFRVHSTSLGIACLALRRPHRPRCRRGQRLLFHSLPLEVGKTRHSQCLSPVVWMSWAKFASLDPRKSDWGVTTVEGASGAEGGGGKFAM